VENINKIVELQDSLNLVYIITIVLASLSMVSIVVFSVLYKIKSKKSRNDLNDTLISSETGSIKIWYICIYIYQQFILCIHYLLLDIDNRKKNVHHIRFDG
jgi:hypothetical protein